MLIKVPSFLLVLPALVFAATGLFDVVIGQGISPYITDRCAGCLNSGCTECEGCQLVEYRSEKCARTKTQACISVHSEPPASAAPQSQLDCLLCFYRTRGTHCPAVNCQQETYMNSVKCLFSGES